MEEYLLFLLHLFLFFSLTTGIIKKLLSITRNKKKQHDKILVLAKSKLNSIETLVSQALADMEISHEEYVTILNAERKIWKNEKKSSWMMCEFRLKIRDFNCWKKFKATLSEKQ